MAKTKSETRERILDVALELFNEQGYDKTSLREIADRLGVTKAALYYHFERKDQILLELHLRLHALSHGMIERLDGLDGPAIVGAWPGIVDELIEQMLANRDLFLLHQRNASAFEQLAGDERHAAENEDLQERFRALLSNESIPLEERVRLAASIGAVFSVMMGAGGMFGDVDAEEVARYARGVVSDLFPVT